MLKFYSSSVFIAANEITQVDVITGDGSTVNFRLVKKQSSQVGDTVQIDATKEPRYLQGWSLPDSTHIQFTTAPPANSQGVIPGVNPVDFECFDTASEPGVSGSANVDTFEVWLADDATDPYNSIVNQKYMPVYGNPGIAIFFQNLCTAAGAQTFWTRIACCDASGNALSYGATAGTIYTASFQALTSLTATAAALATQLTVQSASGFYAGDYIILNPGQVTEEKLKILSINYASNILTTTGVNYPHSKNELVFMQGRKFIVEGTIPIGTLSGTAQSFINLGLFYDTIAESR